MRVLLTNDDGIDAPGLRALETAISRFATVCVVAPDRGYSGCGHQTTSNGSIRVEQLSEQRFKVFGTPADCTRLGLTHLADSIDLVACGVNAGANLGVDIYMSGTVAAAREAIWLGTPSIAFSQYIHQNRMPDWKKTEQMVNRVFESLQTGLGTSGQIVNVNLPDVATGADEIEIKEAFVEPAHLDVAFERADRDQYDFRGQYRNRRRSVGSDVDACFGGSIAVSKIPANP